MEKKKYSIAVIDHKHGTNVYLSETMEGVKKQVAEYCREWWEEEVNDSKPPKNDDEVIEEYFKEENAGWKEGLEYFEDIEVK